MPTDDEIRDRTQQIERIARQVANRLNASSTVRDELYDAAVGHVFSVIHTYDPTLAKFSTWCYTVVRNQCVTLIRQEAKRNKIVKKARGVAEVDEERQLRSAPTASAMEESEEEARASAGTGFQFAPLLDEHLKPIDRLMLAAYLGVLSTLGDDVVARWCREAGHEGAASLAGVEQLPTSQRKEAIAAVLGESLGWVRQRIFRAVQRLKDRGFGGLQR
jgi:RNA polymerase sigma factor (sigma-70 family)